MDRIREERDMFEGQGWDEEIAKLGDPHISFNL